MEDALREAVKNMKDVIEFLEKIKLDKKFRKEKDDLIKGLNSSVSRANTFLLHAKKSDDSGNADVYNDVETSNEVYNDVSPNDASQVYNDTEGGQIYHDTVVQSETHNDVEVPHTPATPTAPGKADTISLVACDDLKDPMMADYLESKRERTLLAGGWKKRWCVLHSNILYLFENPKEKKQKEAIDLQGFTFEIRDDITREAKRKERCFELKNDQTNKSFDARHKSNGVQAMI